MVLRNAMDGRLGVIRRILLSSKTPGPRCSRFSTSTANSSQDGNQHGSKSKTISIGDVTKPLKTPKNPELVPCRYLLNESDIPPETLKHLKWIMQKDLLGQDVFLLGRPSPIRREVAMQYLQLTRREVEYVALSRDTTESDLKQRREIVSGTAHYIDQSAVRAASEGRVLLLEGIEKAERNVLPVLNNLLENREMHLEDGRLLIPASRYDNLLEEYGQEEMDKWKLVRVSEDFRVIALGLPVPHYIGNPLDPPLRSRFQARDVRGLPFKEQFEVLRSIGPRVPSESISQLLSFAHTMVTDESSNLGLPDFPVENLPTLTSVLNLAPSVPLHEAVNRLYPYKSFLPAEGITSVEDTLSTFQLSGASSILYDVKEVDRSKATVKIKIGNEKSEFPAPVGNHAANGGSPSSSTSYVPTSYHDSLIGELMLSHAAHDFCLIGPRGCGKTVIVERLADMLGYEVEPIMLYQDMTARDLLQQRTTLANGDTVWRYSPLVTAALEGKMAVLDGIHRIHRGTLAVLHRLVHDRELQLYDGSRLMSGQRYEEVRRLCGDISEKQMAEEKKILKIKDNFRIVALAEPPTIGSAKGQWLTPEILSMFLFHVMRPLSRMEEHHVLTKMAGNLDQKLESILHLTHTLRASEDASLSSIANSLSTRQLLRMARRQNMFPDENVYESVHKSILARFLPALPKEALDKVMHDLGIDPQDEVAQECGRLSCTIQDGKLTVGNTSVPVYDPSSKTKIPETLFYDTDQNIASMEAMLQDFLLGEHLLLVGNQGVGKNKLVDRLLKLMNRPREYIQLHRDTTVQSLTLQPTVEAGIIRYEDSPLVKAVKAGHILVVDEADKAPTHVTCILKTLVESGEMILSDGRRIVPHDRVLVGNNNDNLIKMHPDFRMFVLANRPGFPFLGNDFFAALGDLFSCHAIDNPTMESEMRMLKQYGPDVPEETLTRLVKAFSELRKMADEDQIQYPYSTREVVNIVKHLQMFPTEGLGQVVRNVFDFDNYDKETRESVDEILHKHGIPIGVSTMNVSLAKEFSLPSRVLFGTLEMMREGKSKKMMRLPYDEVPIQFGDPQSVNVYHEPLDRVEARGLGFSEMQSYWALPFHDFAVVGDVCTTRDSHNRQLFDRINVTTSNPVWLYSMRAVDDKVARMGLNHFFEKGSYRGGANWRQNVIPRLRMTPMGGRFGAVVAIHDEVSNVLLLVEPESGSVINVDLDADSGGLLAPVRELSKYMSSSTTPAANQADSGPRFFRMDTTFAADNKLIFYTPKGNEVRLLDLSGDIPMCYKMELPMSIKSLHVLNDYQYLVVANNNNNINEGDDEGKSQQNLFLLRKDSDQEAMPTGVTPIMQSSNVPNGGIDAIYGLSAKGLKDFGLKLVLGESVTAPNTLMVTSNTYASLAVGFPELEYSANEVYAWPRIGNSSSDDDTSSSSKARAANPSRPPAYGSKQFADPGRNYVFLEDSCQIVRPIPMSDIPSRMTENNHGLSAPGSIQSYLEVVDLMANKLRLIPVPEPAQMSVYASWYKQTYPDQVLSLSKMSNDGLVTVDNSGTVRLWETGLANLERSLAEWRKMVGGQDDRDLMIERDKVGDLDSPKHGKIDPTGAPHVGGNTWAGGTGGRDTAGLGGVGGPYRLDAGHDVHQVSDAVKEQVPEHIRKAAREMNRKAYEERLREIRMSEYDAATYEQYSSQVRKQVQSLKTIINGLQAKAKDRQWLKNQTEGELDDTKLIEGITGEKGIYKKRGEQEPEPGAPQEKPKRLRLVVDVSGSMYRFNGHDQRLERMMESSLMVMEALEGYTERIKYDIVGHSGEESDLPFTSLKSPPANEKERLNTLKTMHAHAQFCMSGDHTLSATVLAINELASKSEDYDESFVIVLSDANFDRYGISPTNFAKILNRKSDEVNAYAIFIGSLGDQAEKLARRLPAGKAFVCLDTKKIPEVLKTIFTATMLK